ncbi:11477_t:CDS:2 [Diversispora eburnea]|uniref:11477_t:CDS:1 n=1 Tax=Diversispora eburnea TaxID=1213867 RepID=A0A9N8YLU7_9GLOM|nr:11477_t:CDS:2 [Diversispora eburnea]
MAWQRVKSLCESIRSKDKYASDSSSARIEVTILMVYINATHLRYAQFVRES